MEVKSKTSDDREVTITASIDELFLLYQATREGRKSKPQQRALALFGDALREADGVIEIRAQEAEDAKEAGDGTGND